MVRCIFQKLMGASNVMFRVLHGSLFIIIGSGGGAWEIESELNVWLYNQYDLYDEENTR